MFSCKKLFKLQIRPPSLILLIATSQDRWIFPSQSWEVRNSMMIIMIMIMMMIIIIIIIITINPYRRYEGTCCWHFHGTGGPRTNLRQPTWCSLNSVHSWYFQNASHVPCNKLLSLCCSANLTHGVDKVKTTILRHGKYVYVVYQN